jgi:hypothetical protein
MYRYLANHTPIIPEIKIIDKVYNDVVGQAQFIFEDAKERFYEELKLSDDVEEFLKMKRKEFYEKSIKYDLISIYKPSALRNNDSIINVLKRMIKTHLPTLPHLKFTYSDEIKNNVSVNAPTKELKVPYSFSFWENEAFGKFAEYTAYQHTLSFINNAIEIFELSSNKNIKGNEFSVVLYFDNDCKEIVRNIDEYDNVYKNLNTTPETNEKTKEINSIQSILIYNIEKIAELANKRIKHLDNLGLADWVFPMKTELVRQLVDREEFNNLENLNTLRKYRIFVDEVNMIQTLDTEALNYSAKLKKKYKTKFNFIKNKSSKTYQVESYIIESASLFIEKQQYKYPWSKFNKGFQDEYAIKKEMPKNDELKRYELRLLDNVTKPDNKEVLAIANAYKYGVQMAKIYKIWEHIIEELPVFERLLFPEDDSFETEPTRYDKLNPKLKENGFYELSKVKILTPLKQKELIKKMLAKEAKHQMSFIKYLGFDKFILDEYTSGNKSKMYQKIGYVLGFNDRTIRGCLSAYNEKSSDRDKTEYQSFLYDKEVEKEYKMLL